MYLIKNQEKLKIFSSSSYFNVGPSDSCYPKTVERNFFKTWKKLWNLLLIKNQNCYGNYFSNSLRTRQHKRYSRLVGKINFFSPKFLRSTFWKEKIFFLSEQRRKTSNCFSTVYLFPLQKIEEHSWRIIRISIQINFGFCVWYLFEYSSDQE